MECKFCHNIFSNKQNLNAHQKRAKYCLKIQGVQIPKKHVCNGCKKSFEITANFRRHQKICKNPNQIEEYKKQIKDLKEELIKLKEQVNILKADKKDLQDRYDNLSNCC